MVELTRCGDQIVVGSESWFIVIIVPRQMETLTVTKYRHKNVKRELFSGSAYVGSHESKPLYILKYK